ncbi:MAG: SGNH/GDSL hydrolase family protein [Clostridia bacterium]|nr:SGNH/GDSL hydrolase family protein [Clostridia bacterium]
MKIREKIKMNLKAFIENGAITIVAFGDSLTYGAFEHGAVDFENVYWNVLRKMINGVNPAIPVNVINSGIGGTNATNSLARLESQVLSHSPDLVIVAFALNDISKNKGTDAYCASLREIFEKCQSIGAEVVFMTENMFNTYVADDTPEGLREYAAKTVEMQKSGLVDKYMNAAKEVASSMGVPVADCYSEWKKLYESGVDTTMLLANRINHPNREMHKLFAEKIFDIILGDENEKSMEDISMCEEATKQ